MNKNDTEWLGSKFQTILACRLRQQTEKNKAGAKITELIHCDVSVLRLCFSILAMADAIYTDGANRLQKFNLTEGKFVLLFLLNETQEELSPHQLADMAGVSRATITGLMEGLEKDGWIVREMQKSDRRRVIVKLTSWGSKQVSKALKSHMSWLQNIFANISTAQQNKLSESLHEMWLRSDIGVKEAKGSVKSAKASKTVKADQGAKTVKKAVKVTGGSTKAKGKGSKRALS